MHARIEIAGRAGHERPVSKEHRVFVLRRAISMAQPSCPTRNFFLETK